MEWGGDGGRNKGKEKWKMEEEGRREEEVNRGGRKGESEDKRRREQNGSKKGAEGTVGRKGRRERRGERRRRMEGHSEPEKGRRRTGVEGLKKKQRGGRKEEGMEGEAEGATGGGREGVQHVASFITEAPEEKKTRQVSRQRTLVVCRRAGQGSASFPLIWRGARVPP